MGKIIEAKAVISAEDRTGAVFDKIAKKFKEVGKGAKVSKEIDRMSKALKGAQENLKAIDGYRGQRNGFFDARTRMRETKVAVEQASRAMAGAVKPTKVMEQNLRQAQRAADDASKAYERQKTAVLNSRQALTKGGVAVSSLIAEHKRLGTAIDQGTAALERRQRIEQRNGGRREIVRQMRAERDASRAETARNLATARTGASGTMLRGMGGAGRKQADTIEANRRLIDGMGAPAREQATRRRQMSEEERQARQDATRTLAGMGGLYLGHKVHQGTEATLHTYREFDKERRFGKAVMGLSDEEQKPLVNQAVHMGATTRYNDVQVLEAQRELAARGLKKDQVMGLMEPAAALGQSLDLHLPDAVKQLEGAIFGFKKDISTLEAAKASARQTADVQVKTAKVSGMTPEDISQTYKYGATPARMAGLSEETLLAFAGISKKANMGGDEAGTAFRALVANVLKPTRGAKEVMLANGMDYKNYQRNPDRIDTEAFTKTVAAQYGVKLDKDVRGGLEKIFTDKKLIASPEKFTPAVMKLLSDNLGGDDAKSKKSIAGLANRFRDASMKGVDANAMVEDLMKLIAKNPAAANAFFGSKQGGRIANALGSPEAFKHLLDEIKNHSEGYSEKISKERNAGYDGAMSRREGSIKNLETAVGRGWDNDGAGGFLTGFVDLQAKVIQGIAELNGTLLSVGSGAAWLGGKAATSAGTIALVGASLSLKGSAAALTAAAARLAGGSVVGAGASAAGSAGAAAAGGAAASGLTIGGAITGGVIAGGAVAGGALDMLTPGTNAGIGSLIFGGESSLEQTNRALRQEREAAAVGAPSVWARRRRKTLPGANGGTGYSTSYETSGGVISDFLYGKQQSSAVLPGFGAGTKTIPVEIVSMRSGADPSGQVGAINNTLDKATSASATAANGGKPIEATVKPDQITAKVETLPPVTGTLEAPQGTLVGQLTILPSLLLTAKLDQMEGSISAMRGTIGSSGGRPAAVSMPGAATTPGAAR